MTYGIKLSSSASSSSDETSSRSSLSFYQGGNEPTDLCMEMQSLQL